MRTPIGRPQSTKEAQEVVGAVQSIKGKVIDKVSDVMSYPARRKAQKSMIESANATKDQRLINESKGAEPIPNDHRSELFRARANAKVRQVDALRAIAKK